MIILQNIIAINYKKLFSIFTPKQDMAHYIFYSSRYYVLKYYSSTFNRGIL